MDKFCGNCGKLCPNEVYCINCGDIRDPKLLKLMAKLGLSKVVSDA